jgi:hypothetical protein
VVYIFERSDQVVRIETRYINEARSFQIVCRFPDGTTTQQMFTGEASFRTRLAETRAQLERDGWQTAGPALLADGWNL